MSEHVFDKQAWSQLDMFNQLGNIGSEVGRALAAKRQRKHDRMLSAFYRGMDLINATVDTWVERKEVALPELLIAREQFANSVLTDNEDKTIEKYFMDFAIAARMRQYS